MMYDKRPDRYEPIGKTPDGRPFWTVNGKTYQVGEDGRLEINSDARTRRDKVENVFPYAEVVDGSLRISLEDMVAFALLRADPVEWAEALWSHPEVRAAFVEKFAQKYDSHFGAADWRAFLNTVGVALHDSRMSAVEAIVRDDEHKRSQKWYYYHAVGEANHLIKVVEDLLRQMLDRVEGAVREVQNNPGLGHVPPLDRIAHEIEGVRERLPLTRLREAPEAAIGHNTTWDAARDYWRETLTSFFPALLPAMPDATFKGCVEAFWTKSAELFVGASAFDGWKESDAEALCWDVLRAAGFLPPEVGSPPAEMLCAYSTGCERPEVCGPAGGCQGNPF